MISISSANSIALLILQQTNASFAPTRKDNAVGALKKNLGLDETDDGKDDARRALEAAFRLDEVDLYVY